MLTLRDATLNKTGALLSGSATITQTDLRTAFPVLDSVTPVASPQGTLTLRGTASLLGFSGAVDATVRVQDGGLVVTPDVPFGGLATVRLFSDPRVAGGRRVGRGRLRRIYGHGHGNARGLIPVTDRR